MPTPEQPAPSLGLLLHDLARMQRRNFNRHARTLGLGLTQTQWQAIALLKRHEGASQAALSELLEVQPITLARLIDRMEGAGWVERRPNPSDRRAVQLYLTAKAQPALEQMTEMAQLVRADMLAGISAKEHKQLIELLSRIRENLMVCDAAEQPGDRERDDVDATQNH